MSDSAMLLNYLKSAKLVVAFRSWRRNWLLSTAPRCLMIGTLTFASLHSGLSSALTLPDAPLLSQSIVQPNIMLLMDNSVSMREVEDQAYLINDPIYDVCENVTRTDGLVVTQLNGSGEVTADVVVGGVDNGLAIFTYDDGNGNTAVYQWGNATSTNHGDTTLYPLACFGGADVDFDLRIPALQTFGTVQLKSKIRPGTSADVGNFLNFFFANADLSGADSWIELEDSDNNGTLDAIGYKPSSDLRLRIVKAAASAVIPTVSGVNMGLASYVDSGDTGAMINVGIQPIQSVDGGVLHSDLLVTELNKLTAEEVTPIGEAFADIGRYFIEGYETTNLTIHPGDGSPNEQQVPGNQVFSSVPQYSAIAPVPDINSPVITDACQQNFIVALTDGLPNESNIVSGYLVGDDNDSFTGSDNDGRGYFQGGVGDEIGSGAIDGSLDDVVLALNDIDLRPGPTPEFAAAKNNIISFFIGGFDTSLTDSSSILSFAADNGVLGSNFDFGVLPANNEAELIDRFEELFDSTKLDAFSQTAVAFNSGSVGSSSALYQATYQSQGPLWSGNLFAFKFLPSVSESGDIVESTPLWNAALKLNERVLDSARGPGSRQIITMGDATRDGVAFTSANYNSNAMAAVIRDDVNGVADNNSTAHEIISFIRGEVDPAVLDPMVYRERIPAVQPPDLPNFGILGDIVNSSPIEVGPPEIGYPDVDPFGTSSERYSTFATDVNYVDRKSVIYVGANDGMVHAFSGDVSVDVNGVHTGDGGEELFAYIPSLLADPSSDNEGLFYLADPNYNHRFYADGQLTASDVFIDNTGGTNPSWRTVVIGGLRSGGKGLFALDVTDPTSFSESNAADILLWEFSGVGGSTAGSDDMGHIFGEPKVAMMNNGQFAVVVGNGYNSTSGVAALMVIFIEAGADGQWTTGDYFTLSTQVGGSNGLSTPALVDLDGDRIADRAYAGDLQGNMWAFDLSDPDPNNWGVAYESGSTPVPLFTADNVDAMNNPIVQPITSAPIVVANDDVATVSSNQPNALVIFGTGQFIEAADFTNDQEQTFYAIWDHGRAELGRDLLTERRLESSGSGTRSMSAQSPYGDPMDWSDITDLDQHGHGWYIDLPVDGERIIFEPDILLGTIFFTTVIPSDSICTVDGGGFLNAIGVDGLATTTPVYDANNDGVIDGDDVGIVSQAIGTPNPNDPTGMPSDSAFIGADDAGCPRNNGQYQIFSDATGEISYRLVCPEDATGLGRMAWQELFGE